MDHKKNTLNIVMIKSFFIVLIGLMALVSCSQQDNDVKDFDVRDQRSVDPILLEVEKSMLMFHKKFDGIISRGSALSTELFNVNASLGSSSYIKTIMETMGVRLGQYCASEDKDNKLEYCKSYALIKEVWQSTLGVSSEPTQFPDGNRFLKKDKYRILSLLSNIALDIKNDPDMLAAYNSTITMNHLNDNDNTARSYPLTITSLDQQMTLLKNEFMTKTDLESASLEEVKQQFYIHFSKLYESANIKASSSDHNSDLLADWDQRMLLPVHTLLMLFGLSVFTPMMLITLSPRGIYSEESAPIGMRNCVPN